MRVYFYRFLNRNALGLILPSKADMLVTALNKVCMLMVAIVLIPVTGKQNLFPSDVVKNIYGYIQPDLDSYIYAQFQLEEIGNNAELYDLPEHQRNIKIKELLECPKVQELIKKCDQYHTQQNCSMSIYRQYDGNCNNIKHPVWGSSSYLMDRYLPAAYEGINGFRKSVIGGHLPNPRKISLKLIDKDNPTKDVSALFTFFGQFVAHDISSAPTWASERVSCCSPAGETLKSCKNVHISKDDPFYKQFNKTCISFRRTAPYPKCNFEKRNPMNKVTSFIDASTLYGHNDDIANYIRTKDGSGKLRSQETAHGELLPANHIPNLIFCPRMQTKKCFQAGDERVNQHAMLTTMHTVFQRFHNAIADKLHAMNPKWEEEKIFQETRRIVIAEYQNIVYAEYLPRLVPRNAMKSYKLSVDEDSTYDDEVNPSGFAEFTTGSFRLHSMVPKTVSKYEPNIRFDETYSNPILIHEGKTESLVSGSCEVPSEKNDRYLTEDVDDFLYRPPGAAFGLDLTMIDVQRERDHGLPRYIDFVRKCSNGGIEIHDFPDLNQIMSDKNAKLLQSIYTNVQDIDLLIGIYMERQSYGIVTGYTASCISAEQLHRLKFGDSFFFTHSNGRYPFTHEQLKSIRNFSFAQFLCQAGGFTSIRKYPMILPRENNYMVNCQSVPLFDLEPWKDSSATDVTDDKSSKKDSASKTCYFYFFCF